MTTTPMTPAQWIRALEAEGVNQQGYSSWTTHGRDDETGKVFGPVNGVVIHHTAGTSSLSLCYNGTSSLPGPLCHTHLSKTGVASMLSVRRANHAGTFAQNAHDAVLAESSVHPYPDAAEPVDGNDHYYGLETENLGNGTDPYPWVQYVQAVKWATAICRFHGWTENSVIGHKEGTRRKIDPKGPVVGPDGRKFDFTMNRFRADVRAALALPAGVWATKEEEVPLTSEEMDEIALRTARKILSLDEIKNPNPATVEENPTVALKTVLGNLEIIARRNDAPSLDEEVAAIKAKVDSLSVGGVDLDALSVKVADELYKRMAE